jgi:arylsulfatase A-like enzyme
MAVPNADTLDARSHQEMQACGGSFGSSNTGTCTGEALMRAMTNSLDTLVGKLLEVVDKLDPNTYVILIGDNGTAMYGRPNLDFIDNMYITRKGRGKGTTYESGARVPMVIRGPNIKAGASSNDYVHTADLFSTILKLAGIEPPAQVANSEGTGTVPLDGVSLTPLLFNTAASVRNPNTGYLLTETVDLLKNNTRQVGARNAGYKVICTNGTGAGACEFYDLAADPLEEYPLPVPGECAGDNKDWTPANPSWHFCRLKQVVETQSFLHL